MIGTIRAATLLGGLLLLSSASFAHAAIIVDLTTPGSSGTINGAIFQQVDPQPTGTGVINTFLRMQDKGIEHGFNTDFRRLPLDEVPGIHTRSLLLAEVPRVKIGGVDYREFLLDINESSVEPLLSLSQLKVYLAAEPDLPNLGSLGTPIYKMDGRENGSVKLNYALNSGSGSGDMLLYVPDANFAGGGPYVYLYSRFGEPIPGDNSDVSASAGFEEWAAGRRGPRGSIVPITPPPVPEPTAMSLVFAAAAMLVRRCRR